MSIETMKQARDALRCAFQNDVSDCAAALIELDIAIEQAEKQEIVYAYRRKGLDYFCTCDKQRYDELADRPHMFEVTTFYTAPPRIKFPVALRKMWTGQEVQKWLDEHVGQSDDELARWKDLAEYRLALLTKMPEDKPWVGLTNDEICEVADIDGADAWLFDVARAIEAKLKEKNHAAGINEESA